jgi:hypothetical protein
LKDRYNVVFVDGILSTEDYHELLQRAKLFVCTESYGCETSRMFDVSAAGGIPLVNWPYAQHYRQYEPDVHAIYFSMIGDDFERTVERALAAPEKLDAISRATRAFTLGEKDCVKIGEYVIRETLRQHAANLQGA